MSKPSTDARGRRYSAAERAEILGYIGDHNRTRGRGGQRAAHLKFGISQLTLKNWMRHGVVARKPGSPAVGDVGVLLGRLQAIHSRIEAQEQALDRLRAEYDRLKAEV